MVSWNDVEEWDADGVAAVGDALVKARNAIVELEDELTDSASPEEWTGPSAESARQNLAKYRQDLETLVTEVAAMVATVDTVEDAVRQLRRDIDEAKGLAATHGFRIDDGRIVEPEGEAGADTASVKSDLVERVDSILAKAKEVDTDLATMLDKVLADKISDEGATTLAQAAEVGRSVFDSTGSWRTTRSIRTRTGWSTSSARRSRSRRPSCSTTSACSGSRTCTTSRTRLSKPRRNGSKDRTPTTAIKMRSGMRTGTRS